MQEESMMLCTPAQTLQAAYAAHTLQAAYLQLVSEAERDLLGMRAQRLNPIFSLIGKARNNLPANTIRLREAGKIQAGVKQVFKVRHAPSCRTFLSTVSPWVIRNEYGFSTSKAACWNG